MKVLATGDWHLGATAMGGWNAAEGMHSSWMEQIRQVKQIVQICNERRVDLMTVGGDIFDNGHPKPEIVAMLVEELNRLEATKVLISGGNHDQQGVPGNHRTPVEAYLASQRWCLAAVNEPAVVDFQGLKVALLPWLKVAGTSALHATSSALADALKRLGDQVAGHPALLSGHLVTTEADYGSTRRSSEIGMTTSVLEASVPTALLESLPTMANLLSHIHRRQDMAERTRYVGATWKVSFAEQMDSKGCEVLELEGNTVISRDQIDFEVRELIEADCSEAGGADPQEVAESANPGDVVRLWRDAEGDPRRWKEAVRIMNDRGVVLEAPRRPKPRAVSVARSAQGATDISTAPIDALRTFMALREVSAGDQEHYLREYADLVADLPMREQPTTPMAELGAVLPAPAFSAPAPSLIPEQAAAPEVAALVWNQFSAPEVDIAPAPSLPVLVPAPAVAPDAVAASAAEPLIPAARRARTRRIAAVVVEHDSEDDLFAGITS